MNPCQRIVDLLRTKPIGQPVEIRGWLRTRRDSREFSFLEINDGSCVANLQVIADRTLPNYLSEVQKLSTGSSLRVAGQLAVSPAKGQEVELRAGEISIYGWADPETFPLQKKRHSFEFLRSIAHLRPRTNALGAVARVRSRLSFAVHDFFRQHGFFQIQTPVITMSDCEGAGELFTVTTLDLASLPGQQGPIRFEDDFFGRPASLTVSGQLEAEVYALALGRVYTFGPTFRAENSHTSRHLAEFWMIEPEMAFCELEDDIELAEKFLKHLVKAARDECREEMELFTRFVDKELPARFAAVLDREFARITYTEAIDLLDKSGRSFEFPVSWGTDLQSEHERYLCEEVFQRPVVVTGYPKTIKPFYMRVNEDGRTVANMDILFPSIGELVGGSQREERFETLAARLEELGLNRADYEWYLDLRRYGTVPHAGFGVGFERLIQFVTGMPNIREVIPFPRTPGSAAF
jgi:asparaginyl-tRNA synthetase